MNAENHRAYMLDALMAPAQANGPAYDLDLLYVECSVCGKPVLWEEGRTRSIITASGMNPEMLDATCLILTEGCPSCRPGNAGFQLHMVKLANLSPDDLALMGRARGHA